MSSFDQDMLDELNLLLKFPTDSLLQGLKIHHDASQSMVKRSIQAILQRPNHPARRWLPN